MDTSQGAQPAGSPSAASARRFDDEWDDTDLEIIAALEDGALQRSGQAWSPPPRQRTPTKLPEPVIPATESQSAPRTEHQSGDTTPTDHDGDMTRGVGRTAGSEPVKRMRVSPPPRSSVFASLQGTLSSWLNIPPKPAPTPPKAAPVQQSMARFISRTVLGSTAPATPSSIVSHGPPSQPLPASPSTAAPSAPSPLTAREAHPPFTAPASSSGPRGGPSGGVGPPAGPSGGPPAGHPRRDLSGGAGGPSGGKGGSGKGGDRSCPFYKRMPGSRFTVDAFRYGRVEGCCAYFLTHFHYDHYGGLSKHWAHGPIYCTPATARLVQANLKVPEQWVRTVEVGWGGTRVVDGWEVTFLDANHCPGAAVILFRRLQSQAYIFHTGDFRAPGVLARYPEVCRLEVEALYLDTTYCDPQYKFPAQEAVLTWAVELVRGALRRWGAGRVLIAVGAYSIGKERVFLSIAEALDCPIYVDAARARTLRLFEWEALSARLTTDAARTPLHVLNIAALNRPQDLHAYLHKYSPRFTTLLALKPTGWTFSEKAGGDLGLIKPKVQGPVQVYGVPYSEHSSYAELEEFVRAVRPRRVVPTVNVASAAKRDQMQTCFRQWLGS